MRRNYAARAEIAPRDMRLGSSGLKTRENEQPPEIRSRRAA
jgi:hypothetical protein